MCPMRLSIESVTAAVCAAGTTATVARRRPLPAGRRGLTAGRLPDSAL
jgi:hypothetical protein